MPNSTNTILTSMTASTQVDTLVPYTPLSKAPFRLNTLIPRNLAFETEQALNQLVKHYGSIDHWVRDQLRYPNEAALHAALAAEQIDSLALYLHQFGRGQGIIIADQTGIGKGRQAAAVIRHAIYQGYLPIFFTRKPDLFTDIYRDLSAIGMSSIKPFLLNTDREAAIKDQEGMTRFSPLSAKAQQELLLDYEEVPIYSAESIAWHKARKIPLPKPEEQASIRIATVINRLPSDYNCIFSTYSQIQAAHFSKRDFLKSIIRKGVEGSQQQPKVVLILDESHMAGGIDSIVGKWMREQLPYTKAACFLSATFAKYPESMPLYATRTALADAQQSEDWLMNNFSE